MKARTLGGLVFEDRASASLALDNEISLELKLKIHKRAKLMAGLQRITGTGSILLIELSSQ